MRILRSRRFRYALALLLTFAAWVAGCWWVAPYRPRNAFATSTSNSSTKGMYYSVTEISPDGGSVSLHSDDNDEFWDLKTGTLIGNVRRDAPSADWPDEFRWILGASRQCSDLRRSLPEKPVNFRNGALEYDLRLPIECQSANGHFWAHSLQDGARFTPFSASDPDTIVFFHVQTKKQIAKLRGTCYPVAISPDGRTAATISIKRVKTKYWLMLEDVESDCLRSELLPIHSGTGGIDSAFYSADGQYLFAHYWDYEATPSEMLNWWDMQGKLVATVPLEWKGNARLIDDDRILVTYDGGRSAWFSPLPARRTGTCFFFDVATGEKRGEWQLLYLSHVSGSETLVGNHHGRYFAILCQIQRPDPNTWLAKKMDAMLHRLGLSKPAEAVPSLVLIDALERREVMRVEAESAQLSRDGRVLVTMNKTGVISVYDLPLRKLWARIFGFAAIGTLGCFVIFVGLRRLARRKQFHCK
jgi:hypothetical protein